MSQISRVAATACALGLSAAAPNLWASPAVVVRLYDVTGAGGAVRNTAMRTASDIARQAGVALQWKDCSQGGTDDPCAAVRGPRELVVRLIPEPDAQPVRAANLLSIHDGGGAGDVQLGFAAVEPATGVSVLATIYYDRVERVAMRNGVEAGVLLGRTIAHEFGHLLLRSRPHSASGLMRAVWPDRGLTDDRSDEWLFSADDGRRLAAAAAAR